MITKFTAPPKTPSSKTCVLSSRGNPASVRELGQPSIGNVYNLDYYRKQKAEAAR